MGASLHYQRFQWGLMILTIINTALLVIGFRGVYWDFIPDFIKQNLGVEFTLLLVITLALSLVYITGTLLDKSGFVRGIFHEAAKRNPRLEEILKRQGQALERQEEILKLLRERKK